MSIVSSLPFHLLPAESGTQNQTRHTKKTYQQGQDSSKTYTLTHT